MHPLDGNSLIQGIEAARNAGFTAELFYRNNKIQCRESGIAYSASQCKLISYNRYEGLTDPADASILFLVECEDGLKGYLSSAYGIYANTELINFMHSVDKKNSL